MKANTKNKKNKSPMRKLLPAAGSLLISAAMLSTSTFAWFTMNKSVEVTGMQVKTRVGSNLLISTTNLDADYTSQTLSQSRKALLEPVSTINGATGTFFYTVDAKANGDAVTDNYIAYDETGTAYNAESAPNGYTTNADAKAGKNSYVKAFQTAYATPSATTLSSDDFGIGYGYVDYTFYIKATSDADVTTGESAVTQKVVMTKCDLDYNAAAIPTATGDIGKVNGPDKAWRIAVFAADVTSTKPGTGTVPTEYIGGTSMATATNQKGLLKLADAAYRDGKAVDSATSVDGTVLDNASTNGVVIGTIDAPNATKYYKVIVRLWLEGEDTSCTSETYAALTEAYSLDMKFEIENSNVGTSAAVKSISSGDFAASTPTFTGDQYDTAAGS